VLKQLAIVFVVVGLTACGGDGRSAPLDLSASPGCYRLADRGADVTAAAPSSDPRASCAEQWRSGAFTRDRPAEAPELALCVGPGGTPIVVPAGDDGVCAQLGLATPE